MFNARLLRSTLVLSPFLLLLAPPAALGLQTQRLQRGGGGGPDRAGVPEVIDFDAIPPGTIVSSVSGSLGTGPIAVQATNPALGAVNAAVAFNSAMPTGEDPDLGSPNVDFGGPGVGAGGSANGPYPNDRALHVVLIVAEDLVDSDGDGLVDDPDDATLMMEPIEFDFGPARARIHSITLLDVEGDRAPATVEMFDAGGASLSTVTLPQVGDNGLGRAVDLGDVDGVARVLVTLNGSGAIDELVFTRRCTGRIGDFVWHDLNRDGVQNAGEPGIMGVDVTLLDGNGQVVATQTTGGKGEYLFEGLCHGDYTVIVDEETLPPDFIPSLCNVGNDALDNDCSPERVALATDDTYEPRVDFGYQTLMDGEIGDRVWHDEDRDGIQDAGEPGLEGVTVLLLDGGGTQIAMDQTDRLGNYLFRGLKAGSYIVEVDAATLPRDFEPTPCDAGRDDAVDNDCSPAPVDLPSGSTVDDTIDFGYASPCTGSLGDRVWYDQDRDGIQDPHETGLEGVRVVLYDGEGVELGFATTGPDGIYGFTGLCAGDYTIEVDESTLPPGYVPSPCNAGGDDDVDNDCSPAMVVLGGDEVRITNVDFGYRGTSVGQIGDFIWFDVNCDGLQGDMEGILAEPGVGGITVLLRDDMGVVLTMMTSNEEGAYQFAGLSTGTYIVEVDATTIPVGLEPAPCNVGTNDSTDNDCSPVTVTLTDEPGLTFGLTVDFAYQTTECEGHGCQIGFWREDPNYTAWPAPYTPDTPFEDVFEDAFPGAHRSEGWFRTVLRTAGPGLEYLGREAIIALLNSASPDVFFELSPQEVIDLFNDAFPGTDEEYEALADYFAGLNDRFCPFTDR